MYDAYAPGKGTYLDLVMGMPELKLNGTASDEVRAIATILQALGIGELGQQINAGIYDYSFSNRPYYNPLHGAVVAIKGGYKEALNYAPMDENFYAALQSYIILAGSMDREIFDANIGAALKNNAKFYTEDMNEGQRRYNEQQRLAAEAARRAAIMAAVNAQVEKAKRSGTSAFYDDYKSRSGSGTNTYGFLSGTQYAIDAFWGTKKSPTVLSVSQSFVDGAWAFVGNQMDAAEGLIRNPIGTLQNMSDVYAANPRYYLPFYAIVEGLVNEAYDFSRAISAGDYDAAAYTLGGKAALFGEIYAGTSLAGAMGPGGVGAGGTGSNPLSNVQYTDKVKGQMANTSDAYHSFPSQIDGMGASGTQSTIVGGDGVSRTLIQIPGNVNGVNGVYEYILDANGVCNHRLFVPQ